MEQQEIFRILGIEVTKDEKAIKAAYREKLVLFNPEDNPEGFKRLRQAFEEACAYARAKEEKTEEEVDDTPSGLWVAKAEALYQSLSGRQDVERWRALFEEEEFQSLEGEEECRRKFFKFMLRHFRFPTNVWKLLDEKLSLAKEERKLRESLPGDFVTYIMHRIERGEDVDFKKFQGKDDADVDGYLRLTENCWRAIQEKKFDYAWQLVEEAEQMELYHPTAAINKMYLLKQKDEAEAVEYAEEVLNRYADDDMIQYHAATIFWQTGSKHRAAEIFEQLKAGNDNHYMANRYLSQWYYELGDYRKAKKCAEIVIGLGFDPDFRKILTQINEELEKELTEHIQKENDANDLLEMCWCLLQDEKFYQGLKCALSIKDRVPEERVTEYYGYLAKVYRECALYQDCISHAKQWRERLYEKIKEEEGTVLEKDLDRIRQSFMLCVSSYHYLAYSDKQYYQKALDEIALMEEKDRQNINLMMEQARIYMEMGEYEKCQELVDILTNEKQLQAARIVSLESFRRQWNAGGVVREARILIEQFPQYARAYDLIAKVFSDLGEKEALGRLIKEAKEKEVKSVYLDAYDYLADYEVRKTYPFKEKLDKFEKKYKKPLQQTGKLEQFEEGEHVITQIFYMHPANYILNIRGLYYMAACQFDKAQADFEKILEDNPADPFAWNNLGCIYKYQGMYEKAMPCFRKAILYMSAEPTSSHYGNLADVYGKIGDYRASAATYEKLDEEFGKHDNVGKDIINCYTYLGEAKKALQTIENYFSQKKMIAYHKKCDVYLASENWPEAAGVLREWKNALKHPGNAQNAPVNPSWTNYYISYAWYLLLGKRKQKKALRVMENAIKNYDHNATESRQVYMQNLAILYFLSGNDKKCVEYAHRIQKEAKGNPINEGFSQKSILFTKALAAFFLEGAGSAGKLLAEEDKCRFCRYCDFPMCGEIQVLRFMTAKRMGKADECREILRKMEEKMPWYLFTKALKIYGE